MYEYICITLFCILLVSLCPLCSVKPSVCFFFSSVAEVAFWSMSQWGLLVTHHSWEAAGRKWREENRGVGVRHEEFSFCGKTLLSLHMAHRDDKNSCLNRPMNKTQEESCLSELVNEWIKDTQERKKGLMQNIKVHVCFLFTTSLFHCSDACEPSVWYLYPLVLAGVFIPRKTLVSERPVEKMLEFWQCGIFTVALSVSPFLLLSVNLSCLSSCLIFFSLWQTRVISLTCKVMFAFWFLQCKH